MASGAPVGASDAACRPLHSVSVNGEDFCVDVRYTNLVYIARGAYGMVCTADDAMTGGRVAIKKIKELFRNLGDAKRILREMKLLRYFRDYNANIIRVVDVMVAPDARDFNDVYIVSELMETNLRNVIASGQPLEDTHFKYFTYQILVALRFVHSANVLHRDLKPANILVNSSCELRVCDFGLARPMHDDGMTPYVQTRWYRAPELLSDCDDYDGRIDMWSVGCVLAEMLGRRPLFTADSPKAQLQRIVKVLGTPSVDELSFISKPAALAAIAEAGRHAKRDLASLFPTASPAAVDLLTQLLQFDPRRRLTAEAALGHPYLKEYHSWTGAVEPVWPHRPILFEFDLIRLTKADIQTRIFSEVERYYRGGRSKPLPGHTNVTGLLPAAGSARVPAPVPSHGPPPPVAHEVPTVSRTRTVASVPEAAAGPSVPHATLVSFSNARSDRHEAFVQVGMYSQSSAGMVAAGAASSSGVPGATATMAAAGPHGVVKPLLPLDGGLSTPPLDLSHTAKCQQDRENAEEAMKSDVRRRRSAAGLQALGSSRNSDSRPGAGAPSTTASRPATDMASLLKSFESAMTTQMDAAVAHVTERVSAMMAPTVDRLSKLEASLAALQQSKPK